MCTNQRFVSITGYNATSSRRRRKRLEPMTIETMEREFRYDNLRLPDPNKKLSIEEVRTAFSATYPDGSQANSGSGTVRVIEPDGITTHLVNMPYNSTSKVFDGAYRIVSSGPSGGWAGVIDPSAFNDGYGNLGPSTSVVRGFVVQPVSSQNPPTSTVTYLLLAAIILLAASLAVLVSWVVIFGRKRVQRNVLKVDFQSIEREAARVENRDFFAKVHDQLKQRQQTKPEEEGSKEDQRDG